MTTVAERIRMIRTSEKLNTDGKMTMERFGAHLGVTKMTVSRLENGVNNLTDQMSRSICREFGVNPEWLRTGDGEMFMKKSRNEQITDFIGDILTNEPDGIKTRLVASLAELDESDWDRILLIARKLVGEREVETTCEADSVAVTESAYEKAFGIASEPESPASNITDGIA